MSRKKQANKKEQQQAKNVETAPAIPLSSQQKIRNLVEEVGQSMFNSLETGDIVINQSQARAEQLNSKCINRLTQSLLDGSFTVSDTIVPYNISTRNLSKYQQIQEQLRDFQLFQQDKSSKKEDQIDIINSKLKQLQQSIRQEKQAQRNQSRRLQSKAKDFVMKLKHQKQEFQEKLKSKQSISRIFVRAYSEDTIRKMKDKLQERIAQKREQLQQKVQNIQKRKLERVQSEVNNEINYWEKVKKYQSSKALRPSFFKSDEQSQSIFPSIHKKMQRYEEVKNDVFSKLKQSQSKSGSILSSRFQKIDDFVLKAKLKLQSFQEKCKREEQTKRRQEEQFKKQGEISSVVSVESREVQTGLNPEFQDNRPGLAISLLRKYNEEKLGRYRTQKVKNEGREKKAKGLLQMRGNDGNESLLNLSVNASTLKLSINPQTKGLLKVSETTPRSKQVGWEKKDANVENKRQAHNKSAIVRQFQSSVNEFIPKSVASNNK